MKNWLIGKMIWLLKKWGVPVVSIPPEVLEIAEIAAEVVDKTSAMPGILSNEYRHAHTYATLKKKLPNSQSRHIGLAIEGVINGIL